MSQKRKKSKQSKTRQPVAIAAGKFKAGCLELMDRVCEQKVEYVITKHGRPVAKLVPCEEDELPNARGAMAGLVVRYGDIVSPDFEAWDETG